MTSGAASWPFGIPVAKLNESFSVATLAVVIWSSGLKRVPCASWPTTGQSPVAAEADAATADAEGAAATADAADAGSAGGLAACAPMVASATSAGALHVRRHRTLQPTRPSQSSLRRT